LSEQQVRDYLLYLKNDKNFASSSLGIAYNAIKIVYSHTAPRDWPTLRRLRVQKERKLPDVLSMDEVRQLIGAVRIPHHRTFFWTVYSRGLRLDEALHLQVGDIDSARMRVHVHRGRGAKDRFVPLPSSTLKVLRQYWITIATRSGCSRPWIESAAEVATHGPACSTVPNLRPAHVRARSCAGAAALRHELAR
jgi:site-specific recombinase XerD